MTEHENKEKENNQVKEQSDINSKENQSFNFRKNRTEINIRNMIIRIVVVLVALYFISSSLELFEEISEFVETMERYQLDELIVTGTLLSFWLVVELFILVRRIQKESITYKKYSNLDSLTKIYNRRGFFQEVNTQFPKGFKQYKHVELYYIDIFSFKMLNDNHSHLFGDKVLIAVTEHLKSIFQENDIIARIGGDEFIVLNTSKTALDTSNIKTKLNRPLLIEKPCDGENINVILSYGVSRYPEDGSTLEKLLNLSDTRMYCMKHEQHQFDNK